MSKNKTDELVQTLDATPKKNKRAKKGFKGFINSFVTTVEQLANFVFYATAVAGGYVLFTQGSVTMKLVGGILLAGGITYFASKSIK